MLFRHDLVSVGQDLLRLEGEIAALTSRVENQAGVDKDLAVVLASLRLASAYVLRAKNQCEPYEGVKRRVGTKGIRRISLANERSKRT